VNSAVRRVAYRAKSVVEGLCEHEPDADTLVRRRIVRRATHLSDQVELKHRSA